MRLYALLILVALVLPLPLAAESHSRISLQNQYFRVYSQPVNDAIAQKIGGPLSRRIEQLHITLGVKPTDTVDIVIIPDRQTYSALTIGRGRIVEFSEAFYDRLERRIFVRSPDQIGEGYLRILLHEYIHWLVDGIFLDAPLWFHEGMATYFSGQFGFEIHFLFLQHRFWGRYLNLSEMQHVYPTHQGEWQLFYLTSSLAIHYIMDKRMDEWNRMWDIVAWAQKADRRLLYHRVFQDAFGQSASGFASDYDRYARRLAYLYIFYGFNALVFSLLPLVILIGWWKRRRRMKYLPDLPVEEMIEDGEEDSESPDQSERNEP